VLVEQAATAVRVIRRNIGSTRLAGATVLADRVERVLAGEAGEPFDLVLADPPYPLTEPALTQVLMRLVDGGWLATPGVVVVERSARTPEPTWPPGLARYDERRYGETRLWYAEHA
jgi:16S rRNA (guanine966-N2)-methyltransferase